MHKIPIIILLVLVVATALVAATRTLSITQEEAGQKAGEYSIFI
jgi:hypothetical protein